MWDRRKIAVVKQWQEHKDDNRHQYRDTFERDGSLFHMTNYDYWKRLAVVFLFVHCVECFLFPSNLISHHLFVRVPITNILLPIVLTRQTQAMEKLIIWRQLSFSSTIFHNFIFCVIFLIFVGSSYSRSFCMNCLFFFWIILLWCAQQWKML